MLISWKGGMLLSGFNNLCHYFSSYEYVKVLI